MKAIRQLIQKSENMSPCMKKQSQINSITKRISSGRKSRFLATWQMLHRVVAMLVLAFVCSGAWAADYVFMNGDYFLGQTTTATTDFVPNASIYTGTSGSTFRNANNYYILYWNGLTFNTNYNTNFDIENNQLKQNGEKRYLNLNGSTWRVSNNNNRATAYTVNKRALTAGTTLSDFSISGNEYISSTATYTHTNAIVDAACTEYTFSALTYYSTNPANAATTERPQEEVTTGYVWSLTGSNGYATVNASNGTITVNSLPDNDVEMTLTCTNGSKSASMKVTLTKSAPVAAGYVFYSGGDNGNYLNSGTTGTTSFNPNTCLWTGTSGGTFKNNAGYYLYRNNNNNGTLGIYTGYSANCTLEGTESGTTGQRLRVGTNSNGWLRFNNNAWSTANTTASNVVFAVTQRHYEGANPTMPTISATRSGNAINFTHTDITGAYSPTYDDYIFYNGTDHYWYNGSLVNKSAIPASKSSWDGVTYAWSITSGDNYVQINPTTGVLTFKNAMPTTATNVTVRLTTTNTGVAELNNKTEDYTFTLTPTAGTLTVPTITGDNIITENGTYSYSATSTSTPSYTTVTGIGDTFYVQNSNILGTQPTASPITYTYALSNNTGYATINSSTGVITVTNVPSTGDHQMTLTVTATADGMTETATLPIHLTKENKITENTGMYVITYQNTAFLGGTAAGGKVTTFNPATCLWTITSDNKWVNTAGGYLYKGGTSTVISTDASNGINWTINGNEDGTTGQYITNGGYWIRYSANSGSGYWTYSNNSSYRTNREVLFAVTKDTYLPFDQNPLIAGDTQIADLGNNSSFHRTQDAIHNTERYVDYVFYNGNHHYFDMDGKAYTPATYSYTWLLSDNADGYATIDAATGVITYTNYVQEDRIITVTLTATATGASNKTATQTVTLKAPQNPTAITAQNVELAVGDPDYTLTYTLTPSTRVYNYVVASGNSDIVTVSPDHVTNTTNTGSFTIHPVSIGSTTLTLSAKKTGTSNAEEACAKTITITVKDRCIRPTVTLDNTTGELTMATTTEGATIHYTLDGSTPTESSPVYDPDNKPVLTATTTVKAITTKADMMTSAVETQTFTQIATPTLTANSDGTITLGCEVEGVTYYYTTDGNDPTLESTQTTGTVSDVASGSTVKVIAVKEGMITSKVGSKEIRYTVATPVIEINEETGAVTITCATPGATIHYTIDNSVPTSTSTTYTTESTLTITNGQTVKAIAYKADYNDSGMATDRYMIPSGVSGNTVILNDYEDHTWTYYAGVDSSVDGGNYNTNYAGKMYSPNPRNVKITYKANGGAVSIDESETEFVYYKTLEESATAGEYQYQVISNPFSKRPTGKGFGGWQITKGADYIKGKAANATLALDEEIVFENLSNPGVNATAAEIEFTATWVNANITRRTNTGDYTYSVTGGNYETNILVIQRSQTGTITTSSPVTIMMVEPDGSVDYRTDYTFSGNITPNNNGVTKIEFTKWNSTNTLNCNNHSVTVGRGMTTTSQCASYVTGVTGKTNNNNLTKYDNSLNYHLKLESGTFTNVSFLAGNDETDGYVTCSGSANKVRGTLGNDYDRSKADNTKLIITNRTFMGYRPTFAEDNKTVETFKCWVKSGNVGSTITVNNNYTGDAGGTFYVSLGGAQTNVGKRTLIVEGGILCGIAGGIDSNNNSTDETFFLRMSGGTVRGVVYGCGAFAATSGHRRFIFTGGQIDGWIAAGCNGTTTTSTGDDVGRLPSDTYVYFGGNASCGTASTTLYNTVEGGNLFGAGNGGTYNTNRPNSGEVQNSNVVVADNSFIYRNAYGGGNQGHTANTANIYITGGHIQGSMFGGSNKNSGTDVNVYMNGGNLDKGLYGGSNSSGTISNNVTMQINGGQVGLDESNTGNIHGGGYGQPTRVTGNVDLTIGKLNAESGATIYGDVYGGSALGYVNGTAASSTKHTNVTLNAGTINGSLYGGGLGDNTNAANVYGPVQVTVNGGSVFDGAVYGCNNVNGAPQRAVSVIVNGTDSHNDNGTANDFTDDTYAINAVYGGGNRANYTYDIPTVTVNNCDNSIKYVYGGGNQATVPSTNVTIHGGNVIGNVFGGGNNADVTGTNIATENKGTRVNIDGGRILNVYGGNNNGGAIAGTIKVSVAESTDGCGVNIDDLYGGGNKAASNAGQITIGKCTNINRVFGGANQADVTGPINLNIVDGNIGTVFGGNNNSGTITGAITVNVNWNGTGNRSLGNVYGGGNLAEYTGNPTVNIINATTTGNVFGGGLGETAVVVGNPTVNIGDWINGHSVIIGGDVFGGGDLAAVEGDPTVTIRDCNTLIMGDLYGGGNAAPVYSTNTTMWGGTVAGNVFGGGNGADSEKNPNGAQVGYKRDDVTTAGTGNATLNVYGGTIGTWNGDECTSGGGIFGGSNTNGNIAGEVKLTLDQRKYNETNSNLITQFGKPAEGDPGCPLQLKEVYGSGNEASYAGTGINFNLGCVSALSEIYGGAKNADMNGDIHLIISSGHFNRVFGGNNLGGRINGSIKVTIDETGCEPVIIDELYGCGNNAAYSVYGYNEDGTVKTSGENPYTSPEVEIISFTHIGKVFGGGYGAEAVVAGNPTVNINVIPGEHAEEDDGTYLDEHKLGSIGTVFGGGNAANVVGNTSVNIGTIAKNAHLTNPGAQVNVGANITGNVYGGGNAADVTGKTNVVVGQPKTTPVAP